MRVGYLIRKGVARVTHPSMTRFDEDNREHVRSVLGWVEGARKGHFPDIDGAQIKCRIATNFWLDTCRCIVFGRRPRHYVLMILYAC
jgi:hypothetical protein